MPISTKFTDGAWLIVGCSLFIISLLKRIYVIIILVLIAGLITGLYRGSHVRALASYQQYIGYHIQLIATIADDATHKNNQTGIKLSNIQIDNKKFGGQVWAGVTGNLNIKRDSQVVISGKLKSGFGGFAASMSFATISSANPPLHISSTRQIRDNFASGLQKAVPQPQATLGLGYLTGQHNNLPQNFVKQLQLVGLIHLVIAGGYNVTILIRFTRRLFAKVSRYMAILSSSAMLLGVTAMTGFIAPMSRTAIVAGLSLAAWYYGRRIHPLVLLPFAAAITALINPSFIWGDAGWYLTFIAYGGLIILGPMLKKFFWGNARSGTIKQILVDTVSVQIVTMPLLAMVFHQYSIYGLPANLLVLPIMPLTMLFTVIAGVGGIMLPISAARIAGWPATHLLNYTEKITNWLANAPGANTVANFNISGLILAYSAILLGVYVLWRKTHYNFRTENIIE